MFILPLMQVQDGEAGEMYITGANNAVGYHRAAVYTLFFRLI